MSSIDLVESPEQVFGCSIDIVATRVIREIIPKRGAVELLFEEIDFIQEENDAGPHKPS
jgi:hypothetical protein